jgi:hypothetical protein
MLKKITKNQFSVMVSVVATDVPADIIRPGVLGSLCAKGYVNVNEGVVSKADRVQSMEITDDVLQIRVNDVLRVY